MLFWVTKKDEEKWEETNLANWYEAESLANVIQANAEAGMGWWEMKNVLGPRPPGVVDRAFHIAFYKHLANKNEE
jgi:hypothetical protein